MRSDLDKVLVERERKGGGGKFPRQIKHRNNLDDLDNVSTHSGIKKAYGKNVESHNRNTKLSTDVLAPLFGLLRKNIGKNWDKFYSQLCKHFDKQNPINAHIFQHLLRAIQIKTRFNADGVIEYNEPRMFNREPPWKPIDWMVEYYVHPKTRCIIKNKHYKTYRQKNRERANEGYAEAESTKKIISTSLEAHKIKDIWYLFEFGLTPSAIMVKKEEFVGGEKRTVEYLYLAIVTDVLASAMNVAHMDIYGKFEEGYKYQDADKQTSYNKSFRTGLNTETRIRYAKTKRQLNHQELKKYGVI